MEIASIVVICSVCLGGFFSIASVIHQLLLSRNQQINAEIHKRALEQQQQALTEIREEMHTDTNNSTSMYLYEDTKHAIKEVEQRLDELYESKADLLEHHIKQLEKWTSLAYSNSPDKPKNIDKIIVDLKADLAQQLSHWDNRLEQLQKQRSQILSSQLALSEKLQENEQKRLEQFNKLYETHSNMLDALQTSYVSRQHSLSELFIESSKALLEATISAPARFVASYFGGGERKSNQENIDKEAQSRKQSEEVEKLLNNDSHSTALRSMAV